MQKKKPKPPYGHFFANTKFVGFFIFYMYIDGKLLDLVPIGENVEVMKILCL